MSVWFAMGGYGMYVWSAYGISVIVLGGLVCYVRRTVQHASRS